MNHIKKKIFIFSVFQYYGPIETWEAKETNKRDHQTVKRMLGARGIPYKELNGLYKGRKERFFLVPEKLQASNHDTREKLVSAICHEFNQECYLVSHNDRASELVYLNEIGIDKHKFVGNFQSVKEEKAKQKENYCFDPTNETYWICA